MKDFLSVSCKILAAVSGGWVVNQLPEINLLPFKIPDYVVLIFAFLVFIVLTFIDHIASNNLFKDQVKPLRHAVSIVLASFLASGCIFILSTNLSMPENFRKACQYVSFFIFVLGLFSAIKKATYFAQENPEESKDAFEETFLQAKSVVIQTNQAIALPINQLLSSEILRAYLRKNLEQQQHLRDRIFELKNRFRYRREALDYLEKIVKQKNLSKEISQHILNSHEVDIVNYEDTREKIRLKINLALKILSIAVKYGRPNALEKAFGSSPILKELVVEKKVYYDAFQLAKSRVNEVAIQNSLSSGAINQIEDRFDDLIRLLNP